MVAQAQLPAELGICHYDSTAASATVLKCVWPLIEKEFTALYHGGGYFIDNNGGNDDGKSEGEFETIATLKTIDANSESVLLPVIIKKKVGAGLVLLSTLHVEQRPEDLTWGTPHDSPEYKRYLLLAEELKKNEFDVWKQLLDLTSLDNKQYIE
jgi:glutamine amidotransferase-like uncharacterized protein